VVEDPEEDLAAVRQPAAGGRPRSCLSVDLGVVLSVPLVRGSRRRLRQMQLIDDD